jgi:Insect cuticle protein.
MDLVAAPATGNVQYQQEEQLANGTVVGKYGILEPNGKLRLVHYTADKDDFRLV